MIKQPANAKKLKDRRHLVFTDTNVKSLPVRRKQYVVWDGGSGRGLAYAAIADGRGASPTAEIIPVVRNRLRALALL